MTWARRQKSQSRLLSSFDERGETDLAEAYHTSIGLELTNDVLRLEFVAAYHGPKPR